MDVSCSIQDVLLKIRKPIHFFRLQWGLPKILFLINRYIVPPMLMFVASFNITHSELTDRDSFNEICE